MRGIASSVVAVALAAFCANAGVAQQTPPAASTPAGSCQSVTAEFLPGQDGDGAADPVLSPGVNVNCDFPAISARLMEEGTVTLRLHVLADGTTGLVELVQTSKHPRLDDAALRIAGTKLKFSPAIKDGRAVEVEREIGVTFKIAPPDPNWFTNASFQNPPPVEQLALGLDGLRWGMTPDDIRQIFPTLGPTMKLRGQPLTNQGALYVDDYQYGGCSFWLTLHFAFGHLSWVTFTSSDACGEGIEIRTRIENELKARYGDTAFRSVGVRDWTQANWKGAVTAVVYNNISLIEVNFHAIAAPPLIIFN